MLHVEYGECVWNEMCVLCCIRGWEYECTRGGLVSVWLCVCEGCVDQCCRTQLSVLMEIFSDCTFQ